MAPNDLALVGLGGVEIYRADRGAVYGDIDDAAGGASCGDEADGLPLKVKVAVAPALLADLSLPPM